MRIGKNWISSPFQQLLRKYMQ